MPRLRYAYAEALLADGQVDAAREWFERAAGVDTEGYTDALERLEALTDEPRRSTAAAGDWFPQRLRSAGSRSTGRSSGGERVVGGSPRWWAEGSPHAISRRDRSPAGRRSPSPQQTRRAAAHNEVVLRGRVAAPVDERELPSGDTIVTARLIVDRDAAALSRSSQRVDTIDCVAWLRRVQRSMRGWSRASGSRSPARSDAGSSAARQGPASRVEVEIRTARRLDKPPRKKTG